MTLWQTIVEWLRDIGWLDRDPNNRDQFLAWIVPLAIAGARQDWISRNADRGRWNVGGNGPDDFNGVLRAWYLMVCVPVLWNKQAEWCRLREFQALAWASRWRENEPGKVWAASVVPSVLPALADACAARDAAGILGGVRWAPAGVPAALPPVRFACCTPLSVLDKMPEACMRRNYAPATDGARVTVRWKREFAGPGESGAMTRHLECAELAAGQLDGAWPGVALHDAWYNRTDYIPGDSGARDRMTIIRLSPDVTFYGMARFRWGEGINWGALWDALGSVLAWAVNVAAEIFGEAPIIGGMIERAGEMTADVLRAAGSLANAPTIRTLRQMAGVAADHADLFRARYQAADPATRARIDAFLKRLES